MVGSFKNCTLLPCFALLRFAVGFVFTFIFFFCWHGRCTLYPLSRKYLFCVELVFPVTGLILESDLSIMMQTSVVYNEMKEMKTIQVDGCSFQLKHTEAAFYFLVTYEYCHWLRERIKKKRGETNKCS